MEITGRVVADASVHELNDEKQVVNFSITINDNYKPKGTIEVKEVTIYINCCYWLITKTVKRLQKEHSYSSLGTLV